MSGSGVGVEQDVEEPSRFRSWRERRSVSSIKRQLGQSDPEIDRKSDERDNERTRLPDSEEIQLGGIVLTEAFTPSTVSSLYQVLERWPIDLSPRRDELVQELARSRSGKHGGWQNLGVVRAPGAFIAGDGIRDAELPSGVDAVWLNVSYVTPSLAMVVATFSFSEEAGDLSGILKRDFAARSFDPYIRIDGRLGGLRARIPWSRPSSYRAGARRSGAAEEKRRACDAVIEGLEEDCGRWFFRKFPGRFAAAGRGERPVIRILLTKEQVPFLERQNWLDAVGLDFALPLWGSSEGSGWWLSEDTWPYRIGPYTMRLAGKRADVARSPGGGEPGDTNWWLTQSLGTDYAPLVARHAMTALLSIYADRLGDLRDKAGIPRRLRRPVREGRLLENYLLRDGLDAATVASDLDVFTEDLDRFRLSVHEFTEYREHLPENARVREPLEYVPLLREAIRTRAARLSADITTATENIKAAAGLRQAVANTRLQRLIVLLSVAAVVIAVVSLLKVSK